MGFVAFIVIRKKLKKEKQLQTNIFNMKSLI